jgi:hypothetical protein
MSWLPARRGKVFNCRTVPAYPPSTNTAASLFFVSILTLPTFGAGAYPYPYGPTHAGAVPTRAIIRWAIKRRTKVPTHEDALGRRDRRDRGKRQKRGQ